MKTNEQWEVEIAQQNTVIASGMDKFQQNIPVLGKVMGKDPTFVLDTLNKHWKAVVDEYQNTTLRNAQILEYWSKKLDRIIVILTQVSNEIDDAIKAKEDGGDLTNVSNKIGESFEKMAEDIEQFLSEKIEVQVPRDWIKVALIGIGSYLVLNKLVKLPPVWSMAAAAALAYLMTTPATVDPSTMLPGVTQQPQLP